jgi:hypothetical protein
MASSARTDLRRRFDAMAKAWRQSASRCSVPAFRSALVLLALFKLLLVSKHDIVAFERPHDDFWQILASGNWYWGAPYSEWTLIQLPVYPLFAALVRLTGLPLRLAIEFVYLGGAAALAVALGRLAVPRWLQTLVFALIAFHPDTFALFDLAFAETLYACLMLYFVALFIRLVIPRSPREQMWSAALFAVVTALMWHCRKESVLLAGLLVLIAVAIVVGVVLGRLDRKRAVRFAGLLVVAPWVTAVVLGVLISGANGLRYGLWQTNQMFAPNYVRAYASLQAIRPDLPIRFVPVTRETRKKAYAVSPSFRELAPFIDGEGENWGAYESRTSMGIQGEIGAGWFYWVLIGAAAKAGHFRSAPEAEDFFGHVADEVTAALDDGRLPRRRVLISFIDPDLSLWLKNVPASFIRLTRRLFPTDAPVRTMPPTDIRPEISDAFDAAANRRAGLADPPRFSVSGWVLAAAHRPTSIQVVDGAGAPIWTRFRPQPRPDVPPLQYNGKPGPPALGFTVGWPASYRPDLVQLRVLMDDGRLALSGPIASLPLAKPVSHLGAEPAFVIALDRLDQPPRGALLLQAAASRVTSWYVPVLAAFALFSAIRLGFAVKGKSHSLGPAVVVLLFVLAIISSRLLLLAILDASAWNALQARYLFPVAVLAAVVPALVLACGRRSRPTLQSGCRE